MTPSCPACWRRQAISAGLRKTTTPLEALLQKLQQAPRALTSSLLRFVDQQPDHEKARRLADQFTRLQQQVEQRQPQPPPSPTGLPLGYFVPQPVYARFAEQLGDVKDHLQILTSASSTPPQEKLELFVMALMKSLDDQISQELARSSTAGTVHEMGKPSRVLQLITQRAAAFDLLSGLRDKEYDATARATIQKINQ